MLGLLPEVLVDREGGYVGGEDVSREGEVGGRLLPPEELDFAMTVGSVMALSLVVEPSRDLALRFFPVSEAHLLFASMKTMPNTILSLTMRLESSSNGSVDRIEDTLRSWAQDSPAMRLFENCS